MCGSLTIKPSHLHTWHFGKERTTLRSWWASSKPPYILTRGPLCHILERWLAWQPSIGGGDSGRDGRQGGQTWGLIGTRICWGKLLTRGREAGFVETRRIQVMHILWGKEARSSRLVGLCVFYEAGATQICRSAWVKFCVPHESGL